MRKGSYENNNIIERLLLDNSDFEPNITVSASHFSRVSRNWESFSNGLLSNDWLVKSRRFVSSLISIYRQQLRSESV